MQKNVVRRWLVRFHAGDSWLKRKTLRFMYYVFIILPYPIRRVGAAAYILQALAMKRLLGVERQNELTPLDEVGTLSFWGVPDVEALSTSLVIDGEVDCALELRYDLLLELPAVERTVRMDCSGGFRNNTLMKGVSIAHLFGLAQVAVHGREHVGVFVNGEDGRFGQELPLRCSSPAVHPILSRC